MREITATRRVFTFDELAPAAKRKATEILRQEAWECLDSDMVSEYVAGRFAYLADGYGGGVLSKRELEARYRVRIYWSVACGQSDDAQISGTLSRDYHPNLAWPEGIDTIRVTARNMGWSSVTNVYLLDDDGEPGAETWDSDIHEVASRFVMGLCKTIYRWAREECEVHTDEQYVLDSFAAAGDQRRFDEDGSLAPVEFWADDEVTA